MTETPSVKIFFLAFRDISTDQLISSGRHIVPSNYAVPQFGNEARHRSFWAGRAILECALRDLGMARNVIVDKEFGYLSLSNLDASPDPFWKVSLSHTETVAVAVIASAPVGIDIEAKDRDVSKVRDRITSEKERQLIPNSVTFAGEKVSGITLAWSAKEAFSKALGVGMKYGFDRLRVDLTGSNPFLATTDLVTPMQVFEPRIEARIHERYLITVCTEKALLDLGAGWRVVDGSEII